ncbi:hypothetical protein [Sphingomonas sp. 1P08PE]|uniref:hypothetical protein n=1 Tax=Sphingomonas sp. 1P08PE TaxID=554122 RepID=UPI0039A00D09
MRHSPAGRRYNRRVLLLALAYVVVLLPAVYLLSRHMVAGPAAYALGVLPALPVIGFFAAIAAYLVEETDEYLRMLVIRQSLIATGIAMTAATVWGFLEGFELLPRLPGFYWAALWFVGLGMGSAVNALLARRMAA